MTEQARPNERQVITDLQRYLRQLSFDFSEIPSPPIDGIFASVTQDALRAYQKMKALPVTGVADLETWSQLFEDYNISLERNTRGGGFYIFPRTPPEYELEPQQEHFLVTVVQYILNELRILYDDIPQNSQSGVYDEATGRGVRVFRQKHGLPDSDKVDRATWNALSDAHRRLTDRNEP